MNTNLRNVSQKAVLITIAVGIWAIVLQNAGVIPTKQSVYVEGGYIRTDVDGTVEVSGNVRVDNRVDVNLDAINGKNAFYDFGGNGNHVRIPVWTGY